MNKHSWINSVHDYVLGHYWRPSEIGICSVNVSERMQSDGTIKLRKGDRIIGGQTVLSLAKFKNQFVSQERSLNIAFEILLDVIPSAIVNRLFSVFESNQTISVRGDRELVAFNNLITETENQCQPDFAFRSGDTRIFIESKTNAGTKHSLTQVQKYILALARWRQMDKKGGRDVLLLTGPSSLVTQWDPKERKAIFQTNNHIDDLLVALKHSPIPPKLGNLKLTQNDRNEITKLMSTATLGYATWQQVGDELQKQLEPKSWKSEPTLAEMLGRTIGSFMIELKRRQLWK